MPKQYAQYLDDPVGFCEQVLGVQLVPYQKRALELLLEPPYRVLCPSANEVGKSFIGACAVLWWHCTRQPSIIVTTAPKFQQVKDVLWKEIRKLARNSKLPIKFLPKDCRIERAADDFAVGTTANDATSFQGQHGVSIFFVIEEATGVDGEMFDAIESMFSPPGHAILGLFNPTQQGTRVHQEMIDAERSRGSQKSWHVVRMSVLEHPNIQAQLNGDPPVIPQAMRLDKFERLLKKWSRPVGCDLEDKQKLHKATDLIWPPLDAKAYCERTKQKPQWLRPGPMAEARLLGRYPSQGADSVWRDGDWIAAVREGMEPLPLKLVVPELGCDVAAMGSDNTATHVRSGFCSLYHEEVNGQSEPDTMARLIALANYYAHWYNEMLGTLSHAERSRLRSISGRDIPIKIDNDGLGGTLSSFMEAEGYKVLRIGAGTKAIEEAEYPNRRSELWFAVAEMARDDQIDFSRLPEEVIDEMRRQAMSVTWSFDSRGRRVVMPKDEMKRKMGRSPDTCDATNLAYATFPDEQYGDAMPMVILKRRNPLGPW